MHRPKTQDGVVQSCAEGRARQQAPQGVTVTTSPTTSTGCQMCFWVSPMQSIQKQPHWEAQPWSCPRQTAAFSEAVSRVLFSSHPRYPTPRLPGTLAHQVTIHSSGSLILNLGWAVGSQGVSREVPFKSLKGPKSSG